MKRLLIIVLVAVMMLAFVACGTNDEAREEKTEEAVNEWSVSIGNFDIISTMVGNSVDTVTQTLKKVSKDGSLKDQECTGYIVSSLLEFAGADAFETLTVVGADGTEFEMTCEVAMLDTTMLVIEQDGEAYKLPRFAVDSEGSDAWVKDVVELIAE